MSLKTGTRRFIFAWVAVFGAVLFAQRLLTPTKISFQMALREAPVAEDLFPCIYYDSGKGFSEAEDICLDHPDRPVDEFETYQTTIPTLWPIRRLRFDPLQRTGVIALRNLVIGRYRFVQVDLAHEFGKTILPLHAVVLSLEGETLVAHLTNDDPYMLLSDNIDRLTGLEPAVVFRAAVLSFLICFPLMMVLGVVHKVGEGARARTWRNPPDSE